MKKFLQKKIKNEKGLTLVELLAVIVILGIIAAIAVPAIGNIIENSRFKAIKGDAQTILSAANMYFAESETKEGETVDLKTLNGEGFINDSGSFKIDSTDVTVTKQNGGNTFSGTGESGSYTLTIKDQTSKQISKMEKP